MKSVGVKRRDSSRRTGDISSPSSYVLDEHYRVERELADRLRNADRAARATLFPAVYDELFARIPDHPQLVWKQNPALRAGQIKRRLRSLRRFLGRDAVYLELGVGDAALASAVAPRVAKVYGIEVSQAIMHNTRVPANVELILSDGVSVPSPEGCATIAFSDQLIEHLHPDDACAQLINVRRALAPGGCHMVITPNRLSGPHDVSRGFDETATGFHLREYTNSELRALLYEAGFSKVNRAFLSSQRLHIEYPVAPVIALESLLMFFGPMGRRVARTRPVSLVLGCRLLAES